jgi:flavorubredoxin
MITDATTRTRIDEISTGIYRINTPVTFASMGDFSFNQYLIADEEPLLFHTGQKELFPLVREAIERVMPIGRLRFISFSHFEADECGSLNSFLDSAPRSEVACGRIMALTSISDYASRPPRILADGEELNLGRHRVRWLDTPHVPHSWDAGLLLETTTGTLFCADLFVQPGRGAQPLVSRDILEESEAYRRNSGYFVESTNTEATLRRLASHKPRTLACMHGSAWTGAGEEALEGLAKAMSLSA